MERRKRALRTLWVWLWTLAIMAGGMIISSGVAEAAHASEVPAGYKAIRTAEDLINIANDPSGNYILMNNIDLSETKKGGSLDISGNGWEPLPRFSGTLDGNGYKISNLTIYDCKDGANLGLFESLESACIYHLGLTDVNISSGTQTAGAMGGIAGEAFIKGKNDPSYISETYVTGKIIGKSSYAGGLIGKTQRIKVSDCYTNMIMSGSSCAGGIFGYSTGYYERYEEVGSEIQNCYVTGTLRAEAGGAIMGTCLRSHISNCYNLEGTASFTSDSYACYHGTELTTNQMHYADYFSGFDFTNTWVIDTRSEYKYPQLRSNPQFPLTMYQLSFSPAAFTYDGTDYTVDYADNTKEGTAKVTVKWYL